MSLMLWQDSHPVHCDRVRGGILVREQIQGSSSTYGTFALVIGLLFWMLLIGRITVYAAELNVVLKRRLWPRDLLDDKAS